MPRQPLLNMTGLDVNRGLDLEDPFPLTPAFSPKEREIVGGAGKGLPCSLYPQLSESYSLSFGERILRKGLCAPWPLEPEKENTQHPTSNIEHPRTRVCAIIGCWAFDVGCWMFPVGRGSRHVRVLAGTVFRQIGLPSPRPSLTPSSQEGEQTPGPVRGYASLDLVLCRMVCFGLFCSVFALRIACC